MSGKKLNLPGVAYVLMSSVVQPSALFGSTHEPVYVNLSILVTRVTFHFIHFILVAVGL